MIVRNGVRYRYYRDEGGEILYDSEPEEGKPEWLSMEQIDKYKEQLVEIEQADKSRMRSQPERGEL